LSKDVARELAALGIIAIIFVVLLEAAKVLVR
jgi:hypothetical protein